MTVRGRLSRAIALFHLLGSFSWEDGRGVVRAAIYLEDVAGALEFDARFAGVQASDLPPVPPPPPPSLTSSSTSSEDGRTSSSSDDGEGEGEGARIHPLEHYLTRPPVLALDESSEQANESSLPSGVEVISVAVGSGDDAATATAPPPPATAAAEAGSDAGSDAGSAAPAEEAAATEAATALALETEATTATETGATEAKATVAMTAAEAAAGTANATDAATSTAPAAEPSSTSTAASTTTAATTAAETNATAPAAATDATSSAPPPPVGDATNADGTNASSVFDRRLERAASTPPPPAEPPSPPSSDALPEVTGEFRPGNGGAGRPPGEGASGGASGGYNGGRGYFDDLALLRPPANSEAEAERYVWYDAKQARFGRDLGPRGNAAYVNVMLPPAWEGKWWEARDREWREAAAAGGTPTGQAQGGADGDAGGQAQNEEDKDEEGGGESEIDASEEGDADAESGAYGGSTAAPAPGDDALDAATAPAVVVASPAATDPGAAVDAAPPSPETRPGAETTESWIDEPPSSPGTEAPPNAENAEGDAAADGGSQRARGLGSAGLRGRRRSLQLSSESLFDSDAGADADSGADESSTEEAVEEAGGANATVAWSGLGEAGPDGPAEVGEANAAAAAPTDANGTDAGAIDANATYFDATAGVDSAGPEDALPNVSAASDAAGLSSASVATSAEPDVEDNAGIAGDAVVDVTVDPAVGSLFADGPPPEVPPEPPSPPPSGHEGPSEPPPPPTRSVPRVADYFCLGDFVDWRVHVRNATRWRGALRQDGKAAEAAAAAAGGGEGGGTGVLHADRGASPVQRGIRSARPIAVLASRGRCPFEDKARLAVVYNHLLTLSGSSVRIAHVIVSNNGTDVDDDPDNPEPLIDMMRHEGTSGDGGSEEGGGEEDYGGKAPIDVGMLYVATSSGDDLRTRMAEREAETGIGSRVDLTMLVPDEEDDGGDGDASSVGNADRMRGLANPLDGAPDESTKYNEDGLVVPSRPGEDATTSHGLHDGTLTRGWFFPATLTRFCLSCGEKSGYGFGRDVSDSGFDANGRPFWDRPSDTSYDAPRPGRFTWPHGDAPPPTYHEYEYAPWLEPLRKLMVAILIVLLVGPFLLAARRWRTVGGRFRVARDENGNRSVRYVGPSVEAFVNGVPDAVEPNGTMMDRMQVFALPEVEYVGEEGSKEDGGASSAEVSAERAADGAVVPEEADDEAHREGVFWFVVPAPPQDRPLPSSSASSAPPIPTSPSRDSLASSNLSRFVSSTTCSICIEEFEPGERLRVLPRCDHLFHTECILPWLTERQGCCPNCKVPVLPDEIQRQRRSRRRPQEGSSSRRPSSYRRRSQPQSRSASRSAASTLASSLEGGDGRDDGADLPDPAALPLTRINSVPYSGRSLESDAEDDAGADVEDAEGAPLMPLLRTVTPDATSPGAPGVVNPVPFGAEGGDETERTDGIDLERGPPTAAEGSPPSLEGVLPTAVQGPGDSPAAPIDRNDDGNAVSLGRYLIATEDRETTPAMPLSDHPDSEMVSEPAAVTQAATPGRTSSPGEEISSATASVDQVAVDLEDQRVTSADADGPTDPAHR